MNKQSDPRRHGYKPTRFDDLSIPDEGDGSSDEVFDPDDEFEDFRPEPKPDLPWWAPFLPYLPFAAPLWMESNMNIDDLDLNFLTEGPDYPMMPAPGVEGIRPPLKPHQEIPDHYGFDLGNPLSPWQLLPDWYKKWIVDTFGTTNPYLREQDGDDPTSHPYGVPGWKYPDVEFGPDDPEEYKPELQYPGFTTPYLKYYGYPWYTFPFYAVP
jgi:hypothetical protein